MLPSLLLVANGSIAHIYELKDKNVKETLRTLKVEEEIPVHTPGGHRDNFFHKPSTQSSFFDPHQEAKEFNHRAFAQKIIENIKALIETHNYKNVSIIAEPQMLGALRLQVDSPLKPFIVQEIGKDGAHANKNDLEGWLKD